MKKAILLLISIVGLTLAMNRCKSGSQISFTEADKVSITSTVLGAVKQFNDTKDLKAYVTVYYTENAIVLMPNVEPIQGREAITSSMKTFGDINMDFNIIDISGKGDLAYVYGKYTLVFLPSGVKDNGKYIEIWRKQADGKWQVNYDIFNTSVPVQSDTTKTH